MARFRSDLPGDVSGKYGKIAVRNRYGKSYISKLPEIYKANQTQAALNNRIKFSRRQTLNSSLRIDKKLVEFWKASDAEGLNDNARLMRRNTPFVEIDRLLPGLGFTPSSGNKMVIKNVSYMGKTVSFDYKILRKNKSALKAPYDICCVMVYDWNNKNNHDLKCKFTRIYTHSEYLPVTKDSGKDFRQVSFMLKDPASGFVEGAERIYFMAAAIKQKQGKKKYEWTETFFEEIPPDRIKELKDSLKTGKNK